MARRPSNNLSNTGISSINKYAYPEIYEHLMLYCFTKKKSHLIIGRKVNFKIPLKQSFQTNLHNFFTISPLLTKAW